MDMKNVLFIALVAFMHANPNASSTPTSQTNPECAKGAELWCYSVINAKECNAVDFCIRAVWEVHRVKNDSGSICGDCKEWVGKARAFIENEDKSGDVIKSLKRTCDLIPLDTLKKTCDDIVDDNIPVILKMLESQMDPDAICSALDFCNNAAIDMAISKISKEIEKLLPFTCSQCQHISSIVEKNFGKIDQDEVLEKLLGVCGETSSFSDSCSSIVMMNFDQIYKKMLGKVNKKTLCESSGSCANHQLVKEGIVDIVQPKHNIESTIPCELCQQLVIHLQKVLASNTTEIEFRGYCVELCDEWAGPFSNKCIDMIFRHYDILYDYLLNKMNASKTCALIDICSLESDELHASTDVTTKPQQAAISIEYSAAFNQTSLTLYNNGSWCSVCQNFIHLLHEALNNQTIDDDLVNLMKKTCKSLPSEVQEQCIRMVELWGDALMWFLDRSSDPTFICPRIKLCPPSVSLDYVEEIAVDAKPSCPFCLMAIKEVREMIESNKTKENIEQHLQIICDQLSGNVLKQCGNFVKKFSEEAVDMILADFTPEEACTFIKLCTNQVVEFRGLVSVRVDEDIEGIEATSTPQCALCKELVKIVEQRVMNKMSKEEIRRELEKSCSHMKKFSAKCKGFVDKYSDEIVDLIAQELEPEEICRQLIYCETESQELLIQRPASEIEAQPQCVICEFVMSKLENELNDKKTEAEIKKAVRNVCAKMPSTVTKSCSHFIDTYFDLIVMLLESMQPSEVCAGMKLCPPATVEYDLKMVDSIQQDIYKCAVCKGFVEALATIVEDSSTEVNLGKLEEKLCEKFSGKYLAKCHDIAKEYGHAIINLMKTLTGSDEICYKIMLCSDAGKGEPRGMLKLT